MSSSKSQLIDDALYRLRIVIDDVSFQAACIDIHLDPALAKNYTDLFNKGMFANREISGLEDMWDVYDSDNWSSMATSLEEAIRVLEELKNE
jgi:hypothetical protein